MDRVENLTRTSESISWEWEVEGWRNQSIVCADEPDDEDDEEE